MEQDESRVRVMSHKESVDYQGITIEEGGKESQSQRSNGGFRYGTGDFGQIFTMRSISWRDLLLGKGGWQRILMLAAAAMLLGFLLFVALPVIVVLLGVGVAVWLVLRLFLGK
ncbi:MAG: hypothetical protein K6F95_03340 [Selenomonas sp.]|uniref:hypothetical protein n=1 Tax=Selenomonas sp. TaxID=2053611 RepID=UPI0025F97E90|nr:hypothetical protein [Selenomonas sp.]MCR5756923.1 hypothetical protein [Selenomonas sp.]